MLTAVVNALWASPMVRKMPPFPKSSGGDVKTP